MARVIRALLPWYSEAEADRRAAATDAVARHGTEARARAARVERMLADYRAADLRIGRMSGR